MSEWKEGGNKFTLNKNIKYFYFQHHNKQECFLAAIPFYFPVKQIHKTNFSLAKELEGLFFLASPGSS